jgi:hypothetical protein
MNEISTPLKIKWIGVKSARDIPTTRPKVQCPYCNHSQITRRQLEEGMLLKCSACHKDFRVLKSIEPEFSLPDMAYGVEFNKDTGNYAMPTYILELIFVKDDLKTAYTEWCKWKGLDPTKRDWEVNGTEMVK